MLGGCETNGDGQQYMSLVLNASDSVSLFQGLGFRQLLRVKTGTFLGAEAAKEGANKTKTAKLAQVANNVAAQQKMTSKAKLAELVFFIYLVIINHMS